MSDQSGRGRRRAVAPRYPLAQWIQYSSDLTDAHKTNNVSEGWYNRFRLIIGKHYLDLYLALKDLTKEQTDVEIMVSKLSIGDWRTHKIEILNKNGYLSRIERKNIVQEYATLEAHDPIVHYLRLLAYIIVISRFLY